MSKSKIRKSEQRYYIEEWDILDIIIGIILIILGYWLAVCISLLIPGLIIGFETPMNSQSVVLMFTEPLPLYLLVIWLAGKKFCFFEKRKRYVEKEEIKTEVSA